MNKKNVLKLTCSILILITTILLTRYAWSRYVKSIDGTATAEVAKFSIKINEQTNEGFELDFAKTMNSNSSVSSGYVAPGTSGVFSLDVDAEDSDVALEYYLSIDFKDKPTNLLLYSDSSYDNLMDLPVSNKKVIIDDIPVMVDNVEVPRADKHRIFTIYWRWKYETGYDEQQIEANDVIDSKYISKKMIVPIQIKAVQKNPSQQEHYFEKSFADTVHLGEQVNYNPENLKLGKTIETDCTYTAQGTITDEQIANQTGSGHSSNQTFCLNDDDCKITTWRVLGINENGEVELMGITQKNLTLNGQAGYINGPSIMNNISAIYGNGKGAIKAESIMVKQINKYTIYDKTTFVSLHNYAYGTKKTLFFFNYAASAALHPNVTFYITSVEDSEGNTVRQAISYGDTKEIEQTHYEYEICSNKKSGIPNSLYDMLTEKDYWIPENTLFLHQNGAACNLGLHAIISGSVSGKSLFTSGGSLNTSGSYCVAPVVTLKSDIKTTGQNLNGVWQLNV